MSAAWMDVQARKVMCAVLHVDQTCFAWSVGLRNLDPKGMPVIGIAGMPYDHGRNSACLHALQQSFKFLFFLDSDVIPPHDAILRLMAHDLPIVSGVYCRRSPPAALPVAQDRNGWIQHLPPQGLREVDVVGAGCLLIRRDTLERLPPQRPGKHWFDWRADLQGLEGTLQPHMSEDFTFCWHAKAYGYKILVDCGVRCRHVGLAQADYGTFSPLDSHTFV